MHFIALVVGPDAGKALEPFEEHDYDLENGEWDGWVFWIGYGWESHPMHGGMLLRDGSRAYSAPWGQVVREKVHAHAIVKDGAWHDDCGKSPEIWAQEIDGILASIGDDEIVHAVGCHI